MHEGKLRAVSVQVQRGDRDNKRLDSYTLSVEEGQSVLGILRYIADHLDPTIGFSYSCRIGLCASCLVRVNGKVVRACTALVNGDTLIEPYKDTTVNRDLVVQLPPVATTTNLTQELQNDDNRDLQRP